MVGNVPRAGVRAFLDLDRVDLVWLLALVVTAFVLRIASPIFPDALSHPLGGAPVTAYGLSYPYQSPPDHDPSGCPDVPVDGNGNITHGNQPTQKHCGLVFDEVYFPVDAAKDLHQPPLDYFDPEPPLAKLLMAPPIAWLGFGGWSWRLSCAIAGSLLVGLVYLIARRLRRERFFAVSAALIVGLDGLEFVESRTGVIDIIAIFLAVSITYAFLLHWQARTRTQWRATLYAMAAIIGLGFGAKLTALAPALVAATLILGRLLEPLALRLVPALRRLAGPREAEARMWRDAAGRRAVLHYGAALLVAGSIFAASYSRYLTIPHDTVYHFVSCDPDPNKGLRDGPDPARNDHQDVPLMRIAGHSIPSIPAAIGNIAGQMRASLTYHDIECRPHHYASRWYTWPVIAHPVLFYADYTRHTTALGHPETAWITDMGNPAVWWPAIPALLFCVWTMTRGPTWWRVATGVVLVAGLGLMIRFFKTAETGVVAVHPRTAPFALGLALMVVFGAVAVISAVVSRRFVPALCVLGYSAAWLMWVLGNEKRVLFFYHMLGALPFMALAYAYTLTALRRTHLTLGRRTVSLAPLSYAALGLVVAGFVFFYPMWTGAPLTPADHEMRLWVADWQ